MPTTSQSPLALLMTSASVALMALGCGGDPSMPKTAKVSGKVTYNGKPVFPGSVTFTPAGGDKMATQSATGQLNEDGTFTLTTFNTGDGAVIGQHTATIEARGDINAMNQPKADGTIAYVLPKPLIPEKYTKLDRSPLKYTVEDGKSNHFEIELEGELGGASKKKGR